MKLQNKVAIITGGGRGIGRSTAIIFTREGCRVVITSRTKKELEETKKIIGKTENILAIEGDVRSEKDVKNIIKKTLDKFGRIDILVNNAGVAYYKPFLETSEKEYDSILDTNLKGTFLFTKHILPIMLKQNSGVIINISSGAGKHGIGGLAVYCASKFGVIGLTESIANELHGTGIKIYAVCPGGVNTKMYLDTWPETNPKSLIQPEEVAEKILSLCLPDCKTPSGVSVDVRKRLF